MSSDSFQPTVFVVDDDAAVRGSLRLLLRSLGQAAEVYGSGSEFLEAYREDRAGCLLLDRRMPVMSGLEVQQRLNERLSILPIIFMAACGDLPVVATAMQAGAVNFLEKPFRDQDLIDAIRVALEKDCANRQALSDRQDIIRRLASLTASEREILDLLALGHSHEAAAEQLGTSQHTLETLCACMMEKMCASSRVHLMRMLLRAKDDSSL